MYLFTTVRLINLENNAIIMHEGSSVKLFVGAETDLIHSCNEQEGLAFLVFLVRALEKKGEQVIWTLDFRN